jgi:oligopeptide/dipeptide ABC transporter ATP-binding protein
LNEPLLSVEGLEVVYRAQGRRLPAITDLSFDVAPGEILGIVGESGCGKSTLGLALLRLLPQNGEIAAGRLRLRGRDIAALDREQLRRIRGSGIAMIFQDPLTSLNPTLTVGAQLRDALRAHGRGLARDRRGRIVAMLDQVGIPDAADRVDRYPHELSGGMRQRVMIAMALLLEPALLVADEPTSALDVTMQMQILELLRVLRRTHGTAILFISHDLGVVSEICDRALVMYAGRAVEEGDIRAIFEQPRHPYTQALLASIPSWRRRGEELGSIRGRVPSLFDLPPACAFADRCPYARAVCREQAPRYLGPAGGRVRCHIYDSASGYAGSRPSPATQAGVR